MGERRPQTYDNHARFDPVFHFFLGPLAIATFVAAVWHAIRHPDYVSLWLSWGALLFVIAVFLIRIYSLKVQDRVIRLEEQVRLKGLAPAALQGRIGEITEDQLVGLRFASDGEVAGLAQKALEGKWTRKQIKEAIQNWKPDTWRV